MRPLKRKDHSLMLINYQKNKKKKIPTEKKSSESYPSLPVPIMPLTPLPHQTLFILLNHQKLLIYNSIHLPHEPLIFLVSPTLLILERYLIE